MSSVAVGGVLVADALAGGVEFVGEAPCVIESTAHAGSHCLEE
jgi:hypothetical protein